MLFNGIILRQTSKYCLCAISSHELSVCAISYAFSNYEVVRMVRWSGTGGHGGDLCKNLNEKLVSW